MQFAQVEQQLKSNDQLATLVSLQKTAQATAALGFVGQTVGVAGATGPLSNGQATWSMTVPKPATGIVTITSATGQTVYTGTYSMNAGTQPFTWDGKGNERHCNGPTATTRLPSRRRMPTASRWRCRPRSRPWSIPPISPRPRRCCRSPVRDYTLDKIRRVIRN